MKYSSKRVKLLNICILLVIIISFTPVQAKDYPGLTEQINSVLADTALAHGIQGVRIESLKDDTVLYDRNSDLTFVPASNFKLLVSATALDKLGPAYRYRTVLYRTGDISGKGVLRGNLVLRGAGDPTLLTAHLKEYVDAVKKSGVKKIEGDIIGDDSLFDDQRLGWGWSWDDEPYYYSAQVSALCLNRNVVNISLKSGAKAGDPVAVSLDPATSYLFVENMSVTGPEKSEKTVSVDRVRGKNIVRISGSVPLDYKPEGPEEAITMEEPALYTVTVLHEMLTAAGIKISGKVKVGKTPDNAQVLATHSSEPMSAILALLNKPSDNLIAEVLLKTVGAEIKGKGTTAAGGEAETDFLQSIGLDIGALRIVDGSGLSRLNYISPKNLVKLLRHMYRHPNSQVYIASLPIAGVDGTLRRRMTGTLAEGNVKAKSGYVSNVSTLSGYVTTKGGEPLVFSIMMNNHLCRNASATALQNKICEYLAGLE